MTGAIVFLTLMPTPDQPTVVCCVCKTVMSEGNPDVVSHGYCPECFEKAKQKLEEDLPNERSSR